MIGIYGFRNIINDKWYIGQSINIETREKEHRRFATNPANKCYNCTFYRAIREYGFENFQFIVLEKCLQTKLDERSIPVGYTKDLYKVRKKSD